MQKINRVKTFFLFTIISFAEVHASTCGMQSIRYTYDKKIIQKQEMICLIGAQNASSKNCLLPTSPTCPSSKIVKTKNFSEFLSEVKSPGVNLCESFGGKASSYEMLIDKKWESFQRCHFKDSVDFIDLETLVTYYKTL